MIYFTIIKFIVHNIALLGDCLSTLGTQGTLIILILTVGHTSVKARNHNAISVDPLNKHALLRRVLPITKVFLRHVAQVGCSDHERIFGELLGSIVSISIRAICSIDDIGLGKAMLFLAKRRCSAKFQSLFKFFHLHPKGDQFGAKTILSHHHQS